ncbi:HAD-IIA family hydrolase [Nocardiopsis sp. RSe5-2]|uniref:HAD-IIA family hydrolase n=1 Tax=Nocardiopsis endophytica TaxID=3018445 RepID=A0ABT4UE13_9ACTN|nr:HAD-IIA family hydrolase [Nocardiopsis endophytica]MDA2815188.1 HAD-IIA family hydrolase [Nocardiopsis endophytica]
MKPADLPLNALYDAALLDLDGVVYIGDRAVPAAPEAIAKARAAGMAAAFVTNNSSRTPSSIAERLTALGVPAAASDVVTSAEAAARLVAERFPAGAPVLVVGDTGLRWALIRRGMRPVTQAAEDPVAVVQGHSPRLGYDLVCQGALAVGRGALFVASNADATAPMGQGILPGNGSFSRVIANATGVEPVVAGKPMRPLHEEGVARTGAERPLVVGDRLDTDIEGAHARGAAGLLVLSGVTGARELAAAPPERRPDYIAWDLSGLNESHPGAEPIPDGAVCAGWTARIRPDGGVALSGGGDRLDGLRAVCAAAWSAPGADPRGALDRLGW